MKQLPDMLADTQVYRYVGWYTRLQKECILQGNGACLWNVPSHEHVLLMHCLKIQQKLLLRFVN